MPASKAVYMGKVLTNGTTFIALYFRSEKNDVNNEIVDKFYWVLSTSSGVPTNERNNALNGYFSSQSAAETDPPDGYTSLPSDDEFKNLKINSYLDLFPFGGLTDTEKNASVQRVKDSLDVFVAAGGNGCVIVLPWGEIFKNMTEQTANDSASWTRAVDLITYAKNKGIKVSLRICLDLDDTILNVGGTGTAFYGLDNQAKDEWGFPARVSGGSGHCSLSYADGKAMMIDFLDKALAKFSPILGSQFLWYSVVMTGQQESGYNYENRNYASGGLSEHYKALFDYSTYAHNAFIAWCTTKYVTVGALNTSWGSSFASLDDITMPTSGISYGTTSEIPFLNIFKTNKGKDWWSFTYETIKAFQVTCYNKRPTGVKYALEYGSCSDVMSALRYSCFISDAGSYSDMIKAQFGAISGKRDLSFSLDVIRSNYSKKKGTEVNSADIYRPPGEPASQYGATTIQEMKDIAFQLAKSAVDSQGKEIIWISDFSNRPVFNAIVETMQQVKSYMNTFNSETTTVATVNYNLGDVLNNYDNVIQRWRAANGDTFSRVNFVQSSTINYDGVGVTNPTSFSLYPISQYNIKDESIKSNGRFTVVNGHLEYNIEGTFYLLCPSHTINYIDTTPATTTIVIVGSDGNEYVRSTQTTGVTNTQEGGKYNNNHPDREYIRDIGDDARFILPILPWFDITCINTGSAAVKFDVFSPDPPESGAINNMDVAVATGNSSTYRLNTTFMSGLPWFKRGIKVNNNRRT